MERHQYHQQRRRGYRRVVKRHFHRRGIRQPVQPLGFLGRRRYHRAPRAMECSERLCQRHRIRRSGGTQHLSQLSGFVVGLLAESRHRDHRRSIAFEFVQSLSGDGQRRLQRARHTRRYHVSADRTDLPLQLQRHHRRHAVQRLRQFAHTTDPQHRAGAERLSAQCRRHVEPAVGAL